MLRLRRRRCGGRFARGWTVLADIRRGWCLGARVTRAILARVRSPYVPPSAEDRFSTPSVVDGTPISGVPRTPPVLVMERVASSLPPVETTSTFSKSPAPLLARFPCTPAEASPLPTSPSSTCSGPVVLWGSLGPSRLRADLVCKACHGSATLFRLWRGCYAIVHGICYGSLGCRRRGATTPRAPCRLEHGWSNG